MLCTKTFKYDEQNGWSVPGFPDLDSERTIVFIFAATKFQDTTQPLRALLEFYQKSHIVGCSTSGEIFQKTVNDDSIVVAVVKFEHTNIRTIQTVIKNRDDSFSVGKQIAQQLFDQQLVHIFVLSDGLNVNGTELVNGITAEVPNNIMVTGGLAGDGSRFSATWTLSKEFGIKSNTVIAVGFYGKRIKVAYGSQGGWDMFGPERVITKATKNILYEIDNQPALDLYKTYLGDRAKDLPSSALLFPMAIRENEQTQNYIVRTILSVDEAIKSMVFAGNMPEKWLAQLMTANFERLIEGAATAADNLKISDLTSEALVIAISCIGRKLVLGERIEEEAEAVLENLPLNIKLVGFYSYGEISPTGLSNCELHNQTMTLTCFTEI